jgi:ubiquinone/menaquinone biosynthesis C-methylase UbiE
MDDRTQRRVQRYGWDRAAAEYDTLWHAQLAPAHHAVLARAAPSPGQQVLDLACGTGLLSLPLAQTLGTQGMVLGVDISGAMVDIAERRARALGLEQARFLRMDAERLNLPDSHFHTAVCALGLMYMPDPEQALREMGRVLRPGGRLVLAVWGERARCGWSAVLSIVDEEVASDVCPWFFRLGQGHALAEACRTAGFTEVLEERIACTLDYSNANDACNAAFVGGPVAMAWSRFDGDTRERATRRYLEAIAAWQHEGGYQIPGEFVVVEAGVPMDMHKV